MEHLEEVVLKDLNHNILFFKRYVDDCLAAVPNNSINDVLSAFNNFHEKIKFTVETEKNNTINFLDMTLIITNHNTIKTKLYNKVTSSSRYLRNYWISR